MKFLGVPSKGWARKTKYPAYFGGEYYFFWGDMKHIDDESKKLAWWNRNYFFAGTICVVLVNILMQAYASDLT